MMAFGNLLRCPVCGQLHPGQNCSTYARMRRVLGPLPLTEKQDAALRKMAELEAEHIPALIELFERCKRLENKKQCTAERARELTPAELPRARWLLRELQDGADSESQVMMLHWIFMCAIGELEPGGFTA